MTHGARRYSAADTAPIEGDTSRRRRGDAILESVRPTLDTRPGGGNSIVSHFDIYIELRASACTQAYMP